MASRQGIPVGTGVAGTGLDDGVDVTLSTDTATRITTTQTPIKSITIRSDPGNTIGIRIGTSAVSQGGPGILVSAGDYMTIPIDDLSKVFFARDTSGASPTFSWVATT